MSLCLSTAIKGTAETSKSTVCQSAKQQFNLLIFIFGLYDKMKLCLSVLFALVALAAAGPVSQPGDVQAALRDFLALGDEVRIAIIPSPI